MKKIYLLFTLLAALFCSQSVCAQKYKLGTEATAGPAPGTSYAIVNATLNTYISCKVSAETGGLLTTLPDDDVLWQIEDTGEKTPAGFTLYYIKSVSQDAYIQEIDFESNPTLDGFDVFNYKGFNFNLGAKATAAKVTIEKGKGGTDTAVGEAWRTVGPSNGFVIARQDSLVREGAATWFFKFGVQNHNVAFEPYNENVGWQFWTVEDNGLKERLQLYVDQFATTEYVGGTDPGYYSAAAVEAYTASLQSALNILVDDNATNAQYQSAIDDLLAKREAVESSLVPITDGYYYIVSGYDDFLNNFGVEKAAYANAEANQLYYKTFDANNVEFVFQITRDTRPNMNEDGSQYWIRNYSTDLYASCGTQWYNSPNNLTTTADVAQVLRNFCPGKWYWANTTFPRTSVTPYASSSPTASNGEGVLTSWGQWGDESTINTHFNLWTLRHVSDEKMAEFAIAKEQFTRTARVEALAQEGRTLYAGLFSYSPSADGLITTAGGNWAFDTKSANTNVEGNQIVFSHIRTQGVDFADNYKFLIDKADSSYMQGSGYIQVDISATPKRIVTFEYDARCSSGKYGNANQHKWGTEERPNSIEIYATNDTTAAGNWTKIAATDMGALPIPARFSVDLGDTYSYLRYNVISNANGGSYFTISEFQVYEATVDQATSQYYIAPGMKEVADKLLTTITEKLNSKATATEQDIQDLESAIAAVRSLYADTAALAAEAKGCASLAATAVVGTEVGQVSSQDVVDALAAAATAASAAVTSTATTAQISAALASLQQAKTAFFDAMKQIEPGKYYYIVSADTSANDIIKGAPIYLIRPNSNNAIMAGYYLEDYSACPYYMWRVLPKDSGKYAIQNLSSGQYMYSYVKGAGSSYVSNSPTDFEINYSGFGAYTIISDTPDNTSRLALSLYPSKFNTTILNYKPEQVGGPSSWYFREVPTDVDAITNNDTQTNTMDVLMLPYDIDNSLGLNDSFRIYGIRKMTQEYNADSILITSIEFYEKQTAAANEPVFYVHGTPGKAEAKNNELMIPFPTDLTDTPVPANGLVGCLVTSSVPVGVAYSDGSELHAVPEPSRIGFRSGVIDPAYYTGEIDSVETAFTLTVANLNPLPSANKYDVNGDGQVNSADIAVVYNFISSGEQSGINQSVADVNGDGAVNSADIAAIYSSISGSSASRKYLSKMFRLAK